MVLETQPCLQAQEVLPRYRLRMFPHDTGSGGSPTIQGGKKCEMRVQEGRQGTGGDSLLQGRPAWSHSSQNSQCCSPVGGHLPANPGGELEPRNTRGLKACRATTLPSRTRGRPELTVKEPLPSCSAQGWLLLSFGYGEAQPLAKNLCEQQEKDQHWVKHPWRKEPIHGEWKFNQSVVSKTLRFAPSFQVPLRTHGSLTCFQSMCY